jgi:hypothetical protein
MRRASDTPPRSGLPVGPLDSYNGRGILRGPSSMIGGLVRMSVAIAIGKPGPWIGYLPA